MTIASLSTVRSRLAYAGCQWRPTLADQLCAVNALAWELTQEAETGLREVYVEDGPHNWRVERVPCPRLTPLGCRLQAHLWHWSDELADRLRVAFWVLTGRGIGR